ncbi:MULTISPECIES: hypothetical protein [Actinomadura]|uniref:Uncharacterized protein n=1 Tax=Actinomadura yumaensis TaxID=111807 RepID=A0ABW2CG38_9ACTN|nr:hypothetical protein [Actinomadura sp. J1-007]
MCDRRPRHASDIASQTFLEAFRVGDRYDGARAGWTDAKPKPPARLPFRD